MAGRRPRHRLGTVYGAYAVALAVAGLVATGAAAVASDEPVAVAAVTTLLAPVNGAVLDLAARRALERGMEDGDAAPPGSAVAGTARTAAACTVLPALVLLAGVAPAAVGADPSPIVGSFALGAAVSAALARRRVAAVEDELGLVLLADRPAALSRTVSWFPEGPGDGP